MGMYMYEFQVRVMRKDKELSKIGAIAENYSAELDALKAEMKEVKDSKLALEIEYQQTKVRSMQVTMYISSQPICVYVWPQYFVFKTQSRAIS